MLRFCTGFYIGLLTPINVIICEQWFLQREKDVVLTILYTGLNVGYLFFAFTGKILMPCTVEVELNIFFLGFMSWQMIFYITGSIAIFSGLLIGIFSTEMPIMNQLIGDDEKALLVPDVAKRLKKKTRKRPLFQLTRDENKAPVPWFKVFKSKACWALLFGFLCQAWQFESVLNYTQTYLTEIHGLSISYVSFLNTVPTNTSMIVFNLVGTFVAQKGISNHWFTIAAVRRIGGGMVVLSSLYFVLIGWLDCATVVQGIVYLLIVSSFRSGSCLSIFPGFVDIAPKYSAGLVSLASVLGTFQNRYCDLTYSTCF